MRYKVAPPARSLDFLERARDAIPLIPGDEGDCCGAIRRATDVTDREQARAYLTFLQALGLVAESERGYYRTQEPLSPETVATAYREQVFLVAELLAAVDAGADDPEATFEAVREAIPRWERERDPEWECHWQSRVKHVLEWAVVFDLLAVENGRFVPSQ
jgi:hypothetical protein